MVNNCIPPKSRIIHIVDVQPCTESLYITFLITIKIINVNAIIENITPKMLKR